eukprot:gene22423-29535_t
MSHRSHDTLDHPEPIPAIPATGLVPIYQSSGPPPHATYPHMPYPPYPYSASPHSMGALGADATAQINLTHASEPYGAETACQLDATQYKPNNWQHADQHPDQYPNQYAGQYPSQYPSQYSSQYPNQYPDQYPYQYLNQYPGQYPNPYTGQYPVLYAGQFPDQYLDQDQAHPNAQAGYEAEEKGWCTRRHAPTGYGALEGESSIDSRSRLSSSTTGSCPEEESGGITHAKQLSAASPAFTPSMVGTTGVPGRRMTTPFGQGRAAPPPVTARMIEEGLMGKTSIENLLQTAPYWVVYLDLMNCTAGRQAVYSVAEMMALRSKSALHVQTLLVGLTAGADGQVPKPNLPRSFFRPLQLLVAICHAGGSYEPLGREDIARGAPPKGWCIPGPGPSQVENSDPPQNGAPLTTSAPPTLISLQSYNQKGGWRAASCVTSTQALAMLAAGSISSLTPLIGTRKPTHKSIWLPTTVLLPLGALADIAVSFACRPRTLDDSDLTWLSKDPIRVVSLGGQVKAASTPPTLQPQPSSAGASKTSPAAAQKPASTTALLASTPKPAVSATSLSMEARAFTSPPAGSTTSAPQPQPSSASAPKIAPPAAQRSASTTASLGTTSKPAASATSLLVEASAITWPPAALTTSAPQPQPLSTSAPKTAPPAAQMSASTTALLDTTIKLDASATSLSMKARAITSPPAALTTSAPQPQPLSASPLKTAPPAAQMSASTTALLDTTIKLDASATSLSIKTSAFTSPPAAFMTSAPQRQTSSVSAPKTAPAGAQKSATTTALLARFRHCIASTPKPAAGATSLSPVLQRVDSGSDREPAAAKESAAPLHVPVHVPQPVLQHVDSGADKESAAAKESAVPWDVPLLVPLHVLQQLDSGADKESAAAKKSAVPTYSAVAMRYQAPASITSKEATASLSTLIGDSSKAPALPKAVVSSTSNSTPPIAPAALKVTAPASSVVENTKTSASTRVASSSQSKSSELQKKLKKSKKSTSAPAAVKATAASPAPTVSPKTASSSPALHMQKPVRVKATTFAALPRAAKPGVSLGSCWRVLVNVVSVACIVVSVFLIVVSVAIVEGSVAVAWAVWAATVNSDVCYHGIGGFDRVVDVGYCCIGGCGCGIGDSQGGYGRWILGVNPPMYFDAVVPNHPHPYGAPAYDASPYSMGALGADATAQMYPSPYASEPYGAETAGQLDAAQLWGLGRGRGSSNGQKSWTERQYCRQGSREGGRMQHTCEAALINFTRVYPPEPLCQAGKCQCQPVYWRWSPTAVPRDPSGQYARHYRCIWEENDHTLESREGCAPRCNSSNDRRGADGQDLH